MWGLVRWVVDETRQQRDALENVLEELGVLRGALEESHVPGFAWVSR